MARGERASWIVVGALAAAAALQQGLGCGPTDTDTGVQADPRVTTLLEHVGPAVVEPALAAFVARTAALADATEALALTDGADPGARTAAQDAWFEAMRAWQRLEVMQVGPAAPSLTDAAGQDLRDAVYAWPSVNRCRVDQETATGGWDADGYFAQAAVNVVGLDALEATLFSPHAENGCPAHTEPNASGAWDALGVDGVASQRAAHADALATHLHDVATALAAKWSPSGDDFSSRLAAVGEGAPYPTQSEALNAVYNALFYLETRTKDRKLGAPLGIQGCATDACVDGVETRLAGGSNVWLAENLIGFRALFTGGDAGGMDVLLAEIGHGDLADAFLAALDAADAAAAALTVPVDEAALGDRDEALALYDAIKGVTDLLKGDLATVLTLQIPQEAAGDND